MRLSKQPNLQKKVYFIVLSHSKKGLTHIPFGKAKGRTFNSGNCGAALAAQSIQKDTAPHPGLPNLGKHTISVISVDFPGNTCYLGCVLQVLYFCPHFREAIKQLNVPHLRGNDSLSCHLTSRFERFRKPRLASHVAG